MKLHTSQRGIDFVSRRGGDGEPLLINGEGSDSSIDVGNRKRRKDAPAAAAAPAVADGEPLGSYSIRKDTRKLESRIETQLTALEQWMVNGQRMLDTQARSGSDQQWDELLNTGDALLTEIESLLDQLADMNSIHAVLTANADSNGFYEQEEVRQRENRQKFLQQSFTRLRHSASALTQKASLCKKAAMLKGGNQSKPKAGTSNLELLAAEQSTLQQASAALDGLVQQAIETRVVLQEQTVYLQEQNEKVDKIAGVMPRINRVMTFVKVRKWRDLIILGLFISICICALLLYALSNRNSSS